MNLKNFAQKKTKKLKVHIKATLRMEGKKKKKLANEAPGKGLTWETKLMQLNIKKKSKSNNKIFKKITEGGGENLNRHFSKENIKKAKKHIKTCPYH